MDSKQPEITNPNDIQRSRILLVDDSQVVRHAVANELRKSGCRVELAADGPAALALIEHRNFDAVLLDVEMPGMDGIEVLRTIRQRFDPTELPVLMLTALDDSAHVLEALKAGANDYVVKDIDIAIGMMRLCSLLKIKRTTDLKNEFIRIASHDLKNLLHVVITGSATLKGMIRAAEGMPPISVELVDAIHRSGTRMNTIVGDFLDFRALVDNELQVTPRAVDMGEVLKRVAKGQKPNCERKEIALSLSYPKDLPKVRVDESMVEQVFDNLVSNAAKFSAPGTRVTITARSTAEGHVAVDVADQGPGFTDEDLPKVFVKYARIGNRPTGGESSSGLGLAISKTLVAINGGEIAVRNNEFERGATFTVCFPVAHETANVPPARAAG